MVKLVAPLKDRVVFKAPRNMSGPNVHRLKMEVLEAFKEEPKAVVIDFSDVDYIDFHGLVLFKDICDIVATFGAQAYATRLRPEIKNLLAEIEVVEKEKREK